MTLQERQVGDVTVVDIHGRIAVQDGASALRDTLEQLVRQNRTNIVLNFADTPYIDSTALGEMIRAYTTLKRRGGALKLVNLTRAIHDLLQVTNLLTIFDTFAGEQDAVRSFSSVRPAP